MWKFLTDEKNVGSMPYGQLEPMGCLPHMLLSPVFIKSERCMSKKLIIVVIYISEWKEWVI